MFVSDYRPTKRIGIEEMDGALLMLRDEADERRANGEADAAWWEGAWAAVHVLRNGRFEYPRDFVAVLENTIKMLSS